MSEARFILSKKKTVEQYNTLLPLCDTISYSYKTNPEVGDVLAETTNCLLSLHEYNNLARVHDKKRVWFLPQSWNAQQARLVLSQGVTKFVVDKEDDLRVLLKEIEKSKTEISLLLRINLKENTIFTGKYYVFGMPQERVNALLPRLAQHALVQQLGVHFHRKTQNISEWSLKEELANFLTPESLKIIDIVNIGGGLPVQYKNVHDKFLHYAFSKIRELHEWLHAQGIQLMLEPGRFIAAPAVMLETEIIGIVGKDITLNCSVFNTCLDTLLVPFKLLVRGEQETGDSYVIKGMTPTSEDIFRYDVKLLQCPKVGDKIIFLNAGAYNFHTLFCNLDQVKTVVVA